MLLVVVLGGGEGNRTDSVSYSCFMLLVAIRISKSFSKNLVVMWGFSSKKEDPVYASVIMAMTMWT